MARKARPVIVDTYTLMADLTGQAPARARDVLEDVKRGRATGAESLDCSFLCQIIYLLFFSKAYSL